VSKFYELPLIPVFALKRFFCANPVGTYVFLRLKNSGIIWALNDLQGLSNLSLFILLWLLVALSGVHPSYDRELLCPEPYLMEVLFNIGNLVLMIRLEFNGFTSRRGLRHKA